LSSSFEEKLEEYLISVSLARELVFDLLIKWSIKIHHKESVLKEYEVMLTFEEENTVRYVGGYVLQVLKEEIHDSDIVSISLEMTRKIKTKTPGLVQ